MIISNCERDRMRPGAERPAAERPRFSAVRSSRVLGSTGQSLPRISRR